MVLKNDVQTIPYHISSVKWIPVTEEAEVLCMGTWGSRANSIQLWHKQRHTNKRGRESEPTGKTDNHSTHHTLTQIEVLGLESTHVNDVAIRQCDSGRKALLYTAGSDGCVQCVTYDSEKQKSGHTSMTSVAVALGPLCPAPSDCRGSVLHHSRQSGALTQIKLSAVDKRKCVSVLEGRLVCFDWDEEGTRPLNVRGMGMESDPISATHWYNRDCVLAAGQATELSLWDTRGKHLRAMDCSDVSTDELGRRIQCITTCGSAADTSIYTGDSSGRVVLWDVRKAGRPVITRQMELGSMLRAGRGGVRTLNIHSRRSKQSMIACVGKALVLLDLRDGLLSEEIEPITIHRDVLPVNTVDVHGDVAVWGSDSGVLGTYSML